MDFPETLATDSEGNCLIATVDELQAFAAYVNTEDDCTNMTFKLVDDIDLSSVESFTPIGNDTNRFNGTFDGDGHTISNLKIFTPEDYQGLFGCVGRSGTIKNVKLENIRIEITGLPRVPHRIYGKNGGEYLMNFVGGLVGYNFGKIFNCSVDGSVNGLRHRVGGIVGNNDGGTVSECFFSGSIRNPTAGLGGIAGLNENGGEIENCKVSCSLNGSGTAVRVGGIVGANYESTVIKCYAVIKRISAKYDVGGVVGFNRRGSDASGYFYDESGEYLDGIGVGQGTDKTMKLYKLSLPRGITVTAICSVDIGGENYYFEDLFWYATVKLTGALSADDEIKFLDSGSDAHLKLDSNIVTVDGLKIELDKLSLPADEFIWSDVENNSATHKKISYRTALSDDNRAIICAADEKILFTLSGIDSTDDITIDDNVVTVPKKNRVANVTIDGEDYDLAPNEIELPTVDDKTELTINDETKPTVDDESESSKIIYELELPTVDDETELTVDDESEPAANDKIYEILLPNGVTATSGTSEIDGKIYCNNDATVILTGALAKDGEIKIFSLDDSRKLKLNNNTVIVSKLTVELDKLSLPADEFIWSPVENNCATYKKISYSVVLSDDNRAIICAADEKILFTLSGINSTDNITVDADNVITVPKENRVADVRINGYKLADSPVTDDDANSKIIDKPDEIIAAPVTANDTKEITVNIAIKISAQGLKISGDAVNTTVT